MRFPFPKLIAAAVLALGLAPAAHAQSILNGTYDVAGAGNTRFVLEVRTNAVNQSTVLGALLKPDDSWTIFSGPFQGNTITATQQTFRNGSAFGQTYRQPTGSVGAAITIDFANGVVDYGAGGKAFARRSFVTNGTTIGVPFNTPPTGWYVSRFRDEFLTVQGEQPGVGYFYEGQGTSAELHIAGYDVTGAPKWFTVNGAMPMSQGAIGTLIGTLKLGGSQENVGSIVLQGRHGLIGAMAVSLPGESLPVLNERWITQYGF